MEYIKRYVDDELKNILECMGAVLIIGPKWCGKTTTATQFAKTIIELQHPTLGKSYIELADVDSLVLLEGENHYGLMKIFRTNHKSDSSAQAI